jgi:cobalt-zinc-cadmium efflux system outer membrane protein
MKHDPWHLTIKKMSHNQAGCNVSIKASASTASLGLILALAISLSPSISHASKKHSLDDLIGIAVNSNPEILAARDQVKAVSGQLSAARAIPNPEFEGVRGQQRLRSQSGTPGPTSSWSVTQPLDMPYTRIPRVNAAEAQLRASEAGRIAKEFELIAKVKNRYYDHVRRQEELKAAKEDLELTRQIRDRIELRYQVGETAKFEFIRAETDYLNVKMIAQASQSRVIQSKSELRRAVGPQLPQDFEIATVKDIKPELLPPLQALLDEVRNQNPELQRARAELESAESRLSLEKNSRLPKLSIKAQQSNEPEFTDRSYGLVLTIPIWDWRIGQVREAAANVSRAKNMVNHESQNIETQIEMAYQAFQTITYQVDILENQVVVQAKDARRIAEASYRFGERGMLEYLDAQRTFRAIRADLIRAKHELALITTEIERLRSNQQTLSKLTEK